MQSQAGTRPDAENLLIVGDLHINEGWLPEEGRYSRREDFFYDEDFFACLRYHDALSNRSHAGNVRYAGRWLLIFNGDTFDFEGLTALPPEGTELEEVCGVRSYSELGERAHLGLETSPRESCWKLGRIARGHPVFFAALGWFLARGHRILILKGNHDPVLLWSEVQEALRAAVWRAYRRYRRHDSDAPPLSSQDVEQRLQFAPWFYYDPAHQLYVEHGNQYEPANHFPNHLEPVTDGGPPRLELPDGMLITRYLINKLEEDCPYVDNVRPITRAYGWMLAEHPWEGVRISLVRSRDLLRAWREIYRRRRDTAGAPPGALPRDPHGGLPASMVTEIACLARQRAQFSWDVWGRLAVDQGLLGLLTLAGIATGMGGVLSLMQLRPSSTGEGPRDGRGRAALRLLLASLALFNSGYLWSDVVNDDLRLDYMPDVARALAQSFARHEIPLCTVVLGHTHIARRDWLAEENIWMLNTGTWIPALTQRPHRWERHLTLVRVAASAAPTEPAPLPPPDLIEWDVTRACPMPVANRRWICR